MPGNAKRLLLLLALLATGAAIGLSLASRYAMGQDWRWESLPSHSAMEAWGAVVAVVLGLLLLQRRPEETGERLFFPAIGFLGMGLLDGFHAVALPGDGFILLRAVAGLVGGAGFALAWARARHAGRLKGLPWAVAAACVLFGCWVLARPGTLPQMAYEGRFTAFPVALNFGAGALFLAADGHTFETANNGLEALDRFRKSRFDLVLTDRAMPVMGGDQMAAEIRKLAPGVPIVLLTGFGKMMMATGEKPPHADVVLSKPVRWSEMRKAMAQLCSPSSIRSGAGAAAPACVS